MMNNSEENIESLASNSNQESDEVSNKETTALNNVVVKKVQNSRIPIPVMQSLAYLTIGSTCLLESKGSDATQNIKKDLKHNQIQLKLGIRVWIDGKRTGHVSYIGKVHFSKGQWIGIVLDEPSGQNDGSLHGRRYFRCRPKYGIFTRATHLTLSPQIAASMPSLSTAAAASCPTTPEHDVVQKSLSDAENSTFDKESQENRLVFSSATSSLQTLNVVDDGDAKASNATFEARQLRKTKIELAVNQEELGKVRKLLIEKDETIENLKQINASMKAEMENLKQINGTMIAEVENLKQLNADNNKNLQTLKNTYSNYENCLATIEGLKSENEAAKKQCDIISAARAQSELKVTKLQNMLESQQRDNEKYASIVENMTLELRSLKKTNYDKDSEIITLKQNIKDFSDARAQSDLNVSQLQHELMTLNEAYKQSKDELLAIGLKLEETKREHATNLKVTTVEHTKLCDELRAKLNAANEKLSLKLEETKREQATNLNVRAKLNAANETLILKEAALIKARQDCNKTMRNLETSRSQLQEQIKEQQAIACQLRTTEESRLQYESDLSNLKQQHEACLAENSTLRNILEDALATSAEKQTALEALRLENNELRRQLANANNATTSNDEKSTGAVRDLEHPEIKETENIQETLIKEKNEQQTTLNSQIASHEDQFVEQKSSATAMSSPIRELQQQVAMKQQAFEESVAEKERMLLEFKNIKDKMELLKLQNHELQIQLGMPATAAQGAEDEKDEATKEMALPYCEKCEVYGHNTFRCDEDEL